MKILNDLQYINKNCGGAVMFGCRSANEPNRSDWHVQEKHLSKYFHVHKTVYAVG